MQLQSQVVDLSYDQGVSKAMVKFKVFPHTKEAIAEIAKDASLDSYDRDILLCLVPVSLPAK
jgi:hypothetical protein